MGRAGKRQRRAQQIPIDNFLGSLDIDDIGESLLDNLGGGDLDPCRRDTTRRWLEQRPNGGVELLTLLARCTNSSFGFLGCVVPCKPPTSRTPNRVFM